MDRQSPIIILAMIIILCMFYNSYLSHIILFQVNFSIVHAGLFNVQHMFLLSDEQLELIWLPLHIRTLV